MIKKYNDNIKKIDDFLESRIINILDSLTDGIIITNENGIVYYINPAYTQFSGLYPNKIVGQHISVVRKGAILPKVLKSWQPIRNHPRRVGNVESYCDFLPLIENNTLLGGLVIVKGVVSIKELLIKLEESNKKILQINKKFKERFPAHFTFNDNIGASSSFNKVKYICHKAAKSDKPIILMGESGTGKEVMAQSIHNESKRAEGPFVGVNCAAMPESLLESELFGYEGGAFSGALRNGKLGWFEIASGGTILLDEITEMPFNLQSKLLRVLQEREITRVGGEKTIPIDVRVIATTNKDINRMVNNGDFRDDLYFRLAVFLIEIPPLRGRGEDILLLADKFIEDQQKRKKHVFTLSNKVIEFFQNYEWPGNIRELRNVIDFACSVTDNYMIEPWDLPETILSTVNIQKSEFKNNRGISLEEIINNTEKNVFMNCIKLFGENLDAKKKIAHKLNISIATVYNKLKKYGLN